MNILVINGTHRPAGTTTELARSFIKGVESCGAQADMVMLRDCKISVCTNCLKCYAYGGEGVAPCSIQDDMDGIIARIVNADGVLLASPVHSGFVSGLMTIFWERLAWRIMRPADPFIQCMSMKTRIDNKVRAVASIISAGGMPEPLRKYCDDGTRWLQSNGPLELHGQWVGDLYMGADFERLPQNSQDWHRVFFLRRLSERQRTQAFELGVKMVRKLQGGSLKPVTVEQAFPPFTKWIVNVISAFKPFYRVAS